VSVGRAVSDAGRIEREHDLSARHHNGAFLYGDTSRFLGNVVVITLEGSPRHADPLREGMEFLQ
jgi:hypothetical protein